jgi:5,10-methylenetetrahydrofolate reductase
VGVAANPGAVDMEREINRFMWKVDAGAEFAVTQPVFDADALFRFLDRAAEWPIPVMAGIWPLRTLREAEFLGNEVPGVVVPEEVIGRMREAQAVSPEREGEEGVAIAREVLSRVRSRVRGVHLNTPGGDVERALAVFEGLSDG